MHRDARPVAERRRALEVFSECIPERRIAVHRGLRNLGLVLERALPRRESGEGEGVAHVDLAGERQRRSLRPCAARDERRASLERGAQRLRDVVAVEHGDEGDRPAALGEHEVEQLELRLVHHADLLRHRDLDRALAALAQRVAVGAHLVLARVAAGERPALVAEVLVQERAGEAEGAGVDGLAQQLFDVGNLGSIGGAI